MGQGKIPQPNDLRERFDRKWRLDAPSGCWIWESAVNGNGYGKIYRNGILEPTHRIAWELYKGAIPKGLVLDHLCRNPACVNPDHLEPVTNAENISRGVIAEVHRARFAAMTHCKRGHPFGGDNLYIAKNGQRVCKTCRLLSKRKFNARIPK